MNSNIVIPLIPREQDINNITFNNIGNNVTPLNQIGAFLGNGKVGLFTNFDKIDCQKMIISTDIKYKDGVYKTNIIETFYTSRIMFLDDYNINENISETMIQQNLNISFSTFNSQFEIKNTQSQEQVNVTTDIYCPYQMPYVNILSIDIVPIQSTSIYEETMNIPIFHEVYTKENLIDVTYNNNYIYIEGYGSIYILCGSGKDIESKQEVAFASGYVFDYQQVNNLGFNIYKQGKNSAINRFLLANVTLNATVKLHVISAHMTSHDFENPLEEVKRIIISSIPKLNLIRSKHLLEWSKKWSTNILINPKPNISSDLQNDIIAINQIIRVALYNIYTCTRDNINSEINPFNLHVVDNEGMLLYEGDLWFLPLLSIIKPDTARSLLEERYNTLAMARQIANGYGYSGAKYPYNTDIVGYRNLIYYDTKSVVSVFNNALISLNVWNYYRVSKNKDWLMSKGFAIMKDIANFFVSLISVENGVYKLSNIYSLSRIEEQSDNSFTNNMVKLAFKYTIEASYELNFTPHEKWNKCFNGLNLMIINPNDFNDLIGVNDESNTTDEMMVNILDILFILMPFYSELYFDPNYVNRNSSSLKRNLDFYLNKINTKFNNHPYNEALLAIVYGMYAQTEEKYVHTFDMFLHNFIENNITKNTGNGTINAWLNMKAYGSNTSNSLISNSILVLIILFGICQIKIEGGITASKFYYNELKINLMTAANMPCHWKSININNIGTNENPRSYLVSNRILFTTQEACTEPAQL